MTLQFALAGSGSRGNAALVRCGATLLMIDCGFSVVETERRLARLGVAPSAITAILVTHEHGDHLSGVGRFANRHGLRVLASAGTRRAGETNGLRCPVEDFDSHETFAVGDIEVRPLIVPHDAAEPTQFLFGDGAKTIAVVTDVGHVTAYLVDAIDGVDSLVLESNHDETLLATGSYPPVIKSRVGGPYGHLSNAQAAALLARVDVSRLSNVVLAHLSAQNNTPELAQASAAAALGCEAPWVLVADQAQGLDWCGA